MKICVFAHTFPRFLGDTAAPFMGTLAESLAKMGHKVIVLVPFDEKLDVVTVRPYEIKFYRYVYPDSLHILGYSRTMKGDKELSLMAYLLSPLLYFWGFLALWKLVREEKIDIISAHWIIPNGFIATLVSKITQVPFTITIPGSDIYLGSKNPLFKWMIGIAAKNANDILSDSHHYLTQLNELGFYPSKTKVIRYGVNMEKFKYETKNKVILNKLHIEEHAPVILAVGRVVAKKGFHYLVEAMPGILSKIPNAKLVIVGEGQEKKELENLAESLKIKKAVIFAGTISYKDLPMYYNIADVFVMPSIKDEKGNIDASPVAMMEAMACGVPVVATGFSGTESIILEGKTGYLVKEKNSLDIAKATIKLLTKNKTISAKLMVRKIAMNNFSSEIIAKNYINIFNSVLI